MKRLILTLGALFLFPALVMGGEKEETYLKDKMIPLAQEFLQRIGQTNDLPSATNQVQKYRVDYFKDRPGCTADMILTNGYDFSFYTETNKTEIWSFQRPIKTYYGFGEDTPKAKIDAVKALSLQNKLNKESALTPATKYFKRLGHREENFHSPEISQCYWTGKESGRLPYFEITWYRKDVDVANLAKNGNTDYKAVIVEVSGIDSSLISYHKYFMPIGSDF